MKLLAGKTALVTGATRGIGRAIAVRFAQEGADIAFTGSVDETGAFVYTFELDENASVDTMWLHKYVNGSKEDDLRGTIVAGKESVTIGNKVITLSNAGGQLIVVVTEA